MEVEPQARARSASDSDATAALKADITSCREALNEAEADIKALTLRITLNDQEMKLLKTGKTLELQGMIHEVAKIQEESTAELGALRAARAQAESELEAIVTMRKEVEEQLEQVQTLKRKRSDDDDGCETLTAGEGETQTEGSGSSSTSPSSSSTVEDTPDGILVPSSKRARRRRDEMVVGRLGRMRHGRARRVGTTVVKTAAAITIGAVAAWTALAF
ncbi:hypothetical protein GYMLUDRAFT_39573, partial [Collybiopsis luxurians FD-317 M1]